LPEFSSHAGRVLAYLQSRRILLMVVGWAGLALAAALVIAGHLAPTVDGRLDPSDISRERGNAFVAAIAPRVSRIYAVYGDDVGVPRSGPMTFAENGIPLGPDQAGHELIRKSGSGAYSHWGNTLYFSSSDGSDPRANGRLYTYRVSAALKPKVERAGIVAALLGLFCLSLCGRLSLPLRPSATGTTSTQPLRLPRAGRAMFALGALWAFALLAVPWLQGAQRLTIDVAGATHAGGHAYYAALPAASSWPWRTATGLTSPLQPSGPELIQDGVPIGRLSPSVIDVARGGEGRFAYFDEVLAFSTSDGSDPRANGRRYDLETSTAPVTSSWLVAFALMAFGASLSLWCGAPNRRNPTAGAIVASDNVSIGLAVVTAVTMLVLNWWSGSTSHLGVASYLPVSDALGYYQCAVSIGLLDTLNSPQFGGEWCSRRALYPAMLSSLLAVSGWRPSIALLLQAAAIGLGTGILLVALRRSFGWIAALFVVLGVAIIAREFALGNFMTESLGLVAGVTGISLLLLSIRRTEPHLPLLLLGLCMLSLGMAIRAGALFALPALAVWLFFATSAMGVQARWRVLFPSVIALGFGLALQFLVLHTLGSDARNTGGNFAATLYGLSTGSRDWSQSYRDFPDLFRISESFAFERIQSAAIANIKARPEVFLISLYQAGRAFVENLFAVGSMKPYNGALTLLLCIGSLRCIACFRKPRYSLLLALFAGELVTAPLIYDSGGQRVFIVTFVGRLALAAVGMSWIIGEALRRAPNPRASIDHQELRHEPDRPLHYAAIGLAAFLVVLTLVPTTPLTAMTRREPMPRSGVCKDNGIEIVTRLGRESMQLTFGQRALPLGRETFGIPPGRLEMDPVSRQAWWLNELQPQPRGTTLVYATQLAAESQGKVIPAFAQAPLSGPPGTFVSLCAIRDTAATVKLGDMAFLRVVDVHPRDGFGRTADGEALQR
jgi:hypothetical protein